MNTVLAALLALLSAARVEAQEIPAVPLIIPELQHDESPALRDLEPLSPASAGPTRTMRAHLRPRLAPAAAAASAAARATLAVRDAAVQDVPAVPAMPAPAQSFDGLDNVDGVLPADPNGAVGPNHYVQMVNLSFAIYDKAGTLLYGPAAGNTLWAGFGGPCQTQNDGDPIVLHDHLADRWVVSQIALPYFPFGPFYQCVAVSKTGDPTGAYHRYAFAVSDTKLNDYPKLAVWPDAYYLTVNQFEPFTSTFAGQGVLAFERDRMLAGQPAQVVAFDLETVDPNLGGMLPGDMDGPPPPAGAPAYFVQFDDDSAGVASQDQLQLWRFHVDWSDPAASTFTGPALLATEPFDSDLCGYALECIPQPGTTRKVHAISDRLMYRLQYRNFGTHESLVVNHTVDAGGDHAGIRWYEVRDPGGAPFIHQQGTYAPDADHRWMASAAMDGNGNLAIGFSVASATTFPSVRYAGRVADDPPGFLAQGEATLVEGGGSQTHESARWGDYSAMSIDPTDQCTFWYTQEYYATTSASDWQTRIGAFRFPSCLVDDAMVTVAATNASEVGPTAGSVTVSRTGATDAELVVDYAVRGNATPGADYVPLSGTVTIPAGSASALIPVTPLDDLLVEGDETVIVDLSPDPAFLPGTPSTAVVVIASDDLPPDLGIAAISVPATGGAGAALTVGDTTRNQGGGPAAASATAFYLSLNTVVDGSDVLLGSRAVPALAAGAVSTASTVVTIPAGTTTGAYYVVARADAGDVLVESQENNNTNARATVIGPDLDITALTAPAAAGAGGTIAVADTTKNQGGGTAPACETFFYLSTNSGLDASDVLLGSRAVPALAAGAASSATTVLTVPVGTTAGAYYVIARADGGDAVVETKENNNTGSAATRVGPDLAIAALTAPATAGPGESIAVTDTTKNQGGADVAASTTAIYLSTNSSFDGGDLPLASRTVPALAVGASHAATTTVVIPPGTASGTYYLIARADADDAIVEAFENNNTSARSIVTGPDLAITAVTAPATAGAGGAIAVGDTTKNQGGGLAGASTTAFYLSTNTTFDGGDVPLGGRAVPALATGAASTASTSLTIPAGTASGTYYLIARADADDVVIETKENNNVGSDGLLVGPNVKITVLSVPTSAGAGATISVTDTTKNEGGGAAAASTTAFYLSTNSTWDAGDVALASRAVPALAAGGSQSAASAVTIPTGTAAGAYYLIARADDAGVVAESQENDNTLSRAISIGPDLTISALSAPTTALGGTAILVTDTTRNAGGGSAPASLTVFYFSLDTVADPSDVVLGSRSVAALAPGASSSGATTLIVPAFAGGTWYVVARADGLDTIAETKETNNTSARAIQVTPGGPQ